MACRGLGGFDYENQVLKGERWPEELGECSAGPVMTPSGGW